MEEERSFATRTLSLIGFGLLAFAITILAGEAVQDRLRPGHAAQRGRGQGEGNAAKAVGAVLVRQPSRLGGSI